MFSCPQCAYPTEHRWQHVQVRASLILLIFLQVAWLVSHSSHPIFWQWGWGWVERWKKERKILLAAKVSELVSRGKPFLHAKHYSFFFLFFSLISHSLYAHRPLPTNFLDLHPLLPQRLVLEFLNLKNISNTISPQSCHSGEKKRIILIVLGRIASLSVFFFLLNQLLPFPCSFKPRGLSWGK